MKKLALIFAVASLTACGGASETSTEETTAPAEDTTMVEEVMEEPADTTEMVSPDEKEVEEISTPMGEDSTTVDSSMEEM